MNGRLACLAAAAGLATTAAVLGPVTAANAQPLSCEPGAKSVAWTNLNHKYVITHATKIKVTAPRTTTVKPAYRQTLTAGSELTSGTNYSASWLLTSLDRHFPGTLSKAGTKTTKPAKSAVTLHAETAGNYVAYNGVKWASGYWAAKTCNSGGTGFTKNGKGVASSWYGDVKGSVKCGAVTAPESAAAAAARYC